jgi:HK97 family phage major capsid protein
VTFGAAATWAKVLDFETQVATANALLGAMAYLTSPGVRAKWKAAVKIAGSQYSDFLWQGGNNLGEGQVNGYKAVATNQIPATGTYAHRVVFGNWADLILAEWAGIDVVVDPYSLKKQGQIEVTITLWTDIGVRHAGSFTISADSGAQ